MEYLQLRQYIISIGNDINFYLVVYPFLRLVIHFLIIAFFQVLFLSHVVHAETSIAPDVENTPTETASTTNPIKFAIGFTITCVILAGLVFYLNGSFDETSFSTYLLDTLSFTTAALVADATADAVNAAIATGQVADSSFPDIVLPNPQNLYELFVEKQEQFKDPDLIFITLKTCMPSTMWDLDTHAILDGNSPVIQYIDSFDRIIVPKEKSYLYHIAKLKAAISSYNMLSATGNLDNTEMFFEYYKERVELYVTQYAEDIYTK